MLSAAHRTEHRFTWATCARPVTRGSLLEGVRKQRFGVPVGSSLFLFTRTETFAKGVRVARGNPQVTKKMANDQINLPSLVVILVLSGLIVRYLFFSSPGGGNNQQGPRDSLSQMRQREAAVERIQQMFPQVDRRTILWDLQRNGGSVAATTEKILSGRMETVSVCYGNSGLLPLKYDICLTLVFLLSSSRRSPSNHRHRRALTAPHHHRHRRRAPGKRRRSRHNRT